MVGEAILAEQDLNTIDWRMLTMTNTSLEKQCQKPTSSFLCTGSLPHLGVNVNVGGLTTASAYPNLTPNRVQCPICLRFSSTKDLGRCLGVPTADYPLKASTNHCHSAPNPRKRKRTEMRSAHDIKFAPCHECLDSIGEEDGRVWGRCDNPKCWSRRGETKSSAYTADGFVTGLIGAEDDGMVAHDVGIGLVCPACSPEGGLGCEHKWICDLCAFWGKFPLVWECPGCQNDFCDKCPGMLDRCVECGCSDLCRDCRQDPGIVQELQFQMAMRGESEESSSPLFAWRCRLCSIPVCKSCVGIAKWGSRVDDCSNCKAQLCMGCRSFMECTGCGEDMCQLCPMESLEVLCERCSSTKDPFGI
ncbi:hypothetical protein VKT23_007830 [Stygiomarasmius scandens]